MVSFEDILKKYRDESFSNSDQGTKFEELMVRFLMTAPVYDGRFEDVRLWKDFRYRNQFGNGHDIGIDIVAKTVGGEYWAVQCKMYQEDQKVSKKDIDSFLSASGKKFALGDGTETQFSQCLIIATVDDLGDNAVSTLENRSPPVSVFLYGNLRDADVDWGALEEGAHGKKARKPLDSLFPHQKKALEKALEHYRDHDRGKLIMACGSGKTFTSLRIAEALLKRDSVNKGCVLFLSPSIALVSQTLREWMNNAADPLWPICVCSDPKASKNDTEYDITDESTAFIESPATTDPHRILEQYRLASRTVVIFSTYQSLDSVREAQAAGLPEFDLIVCDEAHRTTGVIKNSKGTYYTDVHDNAKIRGKRRLYMTATPRIYGEAAKSRAAKKNGSSESIELCSMDDEAKYGKEFFKYSFSQAVEEGRLCDYRVLVLTMDKSRMPPALYTFTKGESDKNTGDYCRIWGCLNAFEKHVYGTDEITGPPMRSAVLFTSTINKSKDLVKEFDEIVKRPGVPVKAEVRHIDGTYDAGKRDRLLTWLRNPDKVPRILSNVRCLSEGVDVPALDAAMFFSDKSSQIDIVQSVGRVMRKAPGKEYGYIIIPVVVDSEADATEALDIGDEYRQVWNIVRALRSHDDRLIDDINTFRLSKKKRPKKIITGDGFESGDEPGAEPTGYPGWSTTLDEYMEAFYAKLVDKVGDRAYLEKWAVKIAKVVPLLQKVLERICLPEDGKNPAFEQYVESLRQNINSDVGEPDAIKMLMQQYVAKPIFEKLFGDNGAVSHNSVFRSIDTMMAHIDRNNGLKEISDELEDFYSEVDSSLEKIDTPEGKQTFIKALYEKFFKLAFPSDQQISGIVYTPEEIVDFIIRSADDILKDEFGKSLTDRNVNILDPFTGTGTFIVHLMNTGLIRREDLERKYREELYANEITLLAYYVATVNIENAYASVAGQDTVPPFENILLTDTFYIVNLVKSKGRQAYGIEKGKDIEIPFDGNRKRIEKEFGTDITVIVGNPPYGATQKSANDNAKKRKYDRRQMLDGKEIESVDGRIADTYLNDIYFPEGKGNVNSVYDNYVRAFRWSADRIRGDGGIIAYVTPNGWLTGSAFVGFRKVLESEFDSIYIYNLRGDQNSGDWRNEGEKVFGSGSKVGICITLLVRHKESSGKAKIRYLQTEDGMKRLAKLESLKGKSFLDLRDVMEVLSPAENGDWIVRRNPVFKTLVPIAGDTHKKFEKFDEKTVFVGYSRGFGTSRDSWDYNYSKSAIQINCSNMIEEYNQQVDSRKQIFDTTKLSWDGNLFKMFDNGLKVTYNPDLIKIANYRPFTKMWMFTDTNFIHELASMPLIYPEGQENLTICVASVGDKKPFSCLMTNTYTDLHFTGTSQCFPLCWYSGGSKKHRSQRGLDDFGDVGGTEGLVRHDGISDWALGQARRRYGPGVSKEDIFYYVYGILHSSDYRKAFDNDLKLSLPRIPFVPSEEDFRTFSDAGRKLADLHLNYESAPYPEGVLVNGTDDIEDILSDVPLLRVTKMKLDAKNRTLRYNDRITVENIPSEAFEYIVNGRSALAWLVDQYQVRTDKESGIVNDPNEYAGPGYILKLVLSVITVSTETMRIVGELPRLSFGEKTAE